MTPGWPSGTGLLLRRALRRDRVRLPAVVLGLAGTAALSAAATAALYPAASDRAGAVAAVRATPALVAVYGPLTGAGSAGALALWKLGTLGAVATAVVAVLTVVRHTRAEEDDGRAELVASTPAGRLAPLVAALLAAACFAAALTAATAAGLVLTGVSWADAAAFAAVWGSAALVFAPVAALAAELAGSARGAITAAVLALLAAYVVRAIGDADDPQRSWLVRVSPLGWGELVEPFGTHRWWLLVFPAAAAVLCSAAALVVHGRRDFGSGWLPTRPGRARGSRLMHGPAGLAWRRERGLFAAWTAGFVAVGVLCGSVTSRVGGLVDSPRMREAVAALGGPQAVTDAFLAAEFGLLAAVAAIVVAAAVLRSANEERARRADLVLSAPLSRTRWLLSHLVVACVGGVVLLAAAGVSVGLTYRPGSASALAEVGRSTAAALAQAPAVVLVACIAAALYGVGRGVAAAVWPVLVAFILVAEVGPVVGAAPWVLDLSPFTHVAHLPGGNYDVTSTLWLTAIAAGLVVVAVAAFRRRDLA